MDEKLLKEGIEQAAREAGDIMIKASHPKVMEKSDMRTSAPRPMKRYRNIWWRGFTGYLVKRSSSGRKTDRMSSPRR